MVAAADADCDAHPATPTTTTTDGRILSTLDATPAPPSPPNRSVPMVPGLKMARLNMAEVKPLEEDEFEEHGLGPDTARAVFRFSGFWDEEEGNDEARQADADTDAARRFADKAVVLEYQKKPDGSYYGPWMLLLDQWVCLPQPSYRLW